jgi:RND family efflux transporter MFP subunit
LDSNAILAVIMMKTTGWSGPFAVALATALLACTEEIESDPGSRPPEGARISLAATASAAEGATDYRTYLYAERDVDVFSRLGSGTYFEQGVVVTSIQVEVGDPVSAGQLLCVLDDEEIRIEFDAVQAKADEARTHYERVEELRQREVTTPSEYDAALYAHRHTEAQLKRARLGLSRTRVRAPFDGVIAKRYIRQGELIQGSTPLFRITAVAPLRARILVPERQAASFNVGAPVQITGLDGATATARVLVVSPTVDPGSGTREVVIELEQPDVFRPGATISVEPALEREVEGQ